MSDSTDAEAGMSDLHSKVKDNLAWLSVKVLLSGLIGLVVTTLLVRNLTLAEYGLYNLLFALLGYISLVSSFGISTVFQRYIPELYQKKDYRSIDKVVVRGMAIEFAAVTVCLLLMALFSEPLGRVLKTGEWAGYFTFFSPYYLLMLEGGLLAIVLSSLFMQKYVTIAEVGTSVLRVVAIGAALMLGLSLKGVVFAEVSAALLYTGLLSFFYVVKFRRAHPAGAKTGSISTRRLVRYGGFTFVNDMGSSILDETTDYLILSAYLGPAAVGLYAFAVRIVQMFTRFFPTNIFRMLVHPVFFLKYAENKDYGELNKMFNLLAKFNAFLCVPFCVGLFVLGDKAIVHVFSEEYLQSLTTMRIVVVYVTLSTLMTSVGLVIKSIERVEILLKSKIFSVYNLVGDLLVAPVFGIVGVAVVTGSAVLLKDLYCYYYARKYTGISIAWRGMIVILVNALLMGGAALAMRPMVTGLVSLGVTVLLAVLLYGLLSWLHKPFTRDESRIINGLLPMLRFPF